MGGIALPALDLRPPQQQPDPVEQYMRLKQFQNQQQLQQQGIQSGQLENQQRQQQIQIQQRQMQDQQTLMQVLGKHNGNLTSALPELAGKVLPQTYIPLAQHDAQMREANAKASDDELTAKQKQNSQQRQLLTEAQNMKPDEYLQNWPVIAQQAKTINPALQLDPNQPIPQNKLNVFKIGLDTEESYNAREKARREEAASVATLPGQLAESATKIAQAQVAPAQAQATLRETQAKGAEATQRARLGVGGVAAAEAAGKVQGEMNAMGGMGAGGPAGAPNANLPAGQRDEAYLNTLNGNVKTTVQAIAEGRIPLPSGFALKSPYWQNMLAMVSKYDPSFDAVNYNARSQTRRAFTSGTPAQQVNAINTAVGHLDQLSSAVDQLGNTSIPAANSIKNWFSQETGSAKVTNFKTIVKPVADELTRVWRGTGGSEKDIQDRLNALSSSGSPEQLHQSIAEIGDLMKSKLDALGNQYGQGMGTAPVKMITPQAEQVLGRLTQKAGEGSQAAPAGQPMTATGPNGHKIMVKDGKWVDAQTGAPIQ